MSSSPVAGGAPDPREGQGRRAALSHFLASVQADHAMLRRYDEKYDARGRTPGSIAHDLVERIGFQMMTACRVMRLAREAGSPLAAKVTARLIRLVYGADIHWEARFADGVIINHGMGLAINHGVRIGKGVILSHNVTLGEGIDRVTRVVGQPTIEEDVHIGAGATLAGPITIGARSKIGPGAVVLSSVPPDSVVEAPAPQVRSRTRSGAVGPASAPGPADPEQPPDPGRRAAA